MQVEDKDARNVSHRGRNAGIGAAVGGGMGLAAGGLVGGGLIMASRRPRAALKAFEKTQGGFQKIRPKDIRAGDISIGSSAHSDMAEAIPTYLNKSAASHTAVYGNNFDGELVYPKLGTRNAFGQGTKYSPQAYSGATRRGEGEIIFRPNFKDDAQKELFLKNLDENYAKYAQQGKMAAKEGKAGIPEVEAVFEGINKRFEDHGMKMPGVFKRAKAGLDMAYQGYKQQTVQGSFAAHGLLRNFTNKTQDEAFICATAISDAMKRSGMGDMLPAYSNRHFLPQDMLNMKNGTYYNASMLNAEKLMDKDRKIGKRNFGSYRKNEKRALYGGAGLAGAGLVSGAGLGAGLGAMKRD
jgi:hypothetical protein